MKTFNYRGRNVEGALINGVIQAASVEAAADQLFAVAGLRRSKLSLK